MDRNTRHLLPYWGIALVFGSLVVAGLVAAILRKDYGAPCAAAVTLTAFVGLTWYRRRKLWGLLQNKTAAPAVAYFRKNGSRVPHGDAISASLCGLVLALYGDFEEARDELSTVSWDKVPPVYQGMRVQALAVIVLLQERDYRKAADLAAEMRDLVTVNAVMPGSKTSRRATDAFCGACELLAGVATGEMVAQLEEVIGKLRPLDVAVVAWALTEYFRRVRDAKGGEKYAAMVRELAPHCVPLMQVEPA